MMSAKAPKAEKSGPIHAFDFFEKPVATPLPAAVACFGNDDFLRRTAITLIKESSGVEAESIRSFDGEDCQWRDVHDQLATRSLFDAQGVRVAIVRNADKFISKHRETIEKWIGGGHVDSTLILDIQTLPANVKIYTLIAKHGLLVKCTPPQKASWGNPPDDKAIQAWIQSWGAKTHGVALTSSQAALMVERIGSVCGLIDVEIAKLALFADSKGRVEDARVYELVGGWRTQTAWEVADAIADGDTARALEEFEKLLHAGQTTVGLAAQISWSLRRFGVAAQLIEIGEKQGEKLALSVAMERAGFNKYDIGKAEKRLRRMGRDRAKSLLNGLVELEKQLKGSHSGEHRARFAFESLIFSLS